MGFGENAGDNKFKKIELHLTFPMLEVLERAVSMYRDMTQLHHLKLMEHEDYLRKCKMQEEADSVKKESNRQFSYWDDAMTLSFLLSNAMKKWNKEDKVDDLELGHALTTVEGLQRGAYTYSEYEEEECPECKKEGYLSKRAGIVSCSDCHDKAKREEE